MANSLDDIVDFKHFFFKLLKNWHLLVLSLLLSFAIAFAYNRYSTAYFFVDTSILVKDENSLSTASDLLYEKVSYNNKFLENKELMLKSFPLIYKTLEDLRFDIAYFLEGNIKVSSLA